MRCTHHLISLAGLALSAACAPHVVSSGSPAPTAPVQGQWLRITRCATYDCSASQGRYEGYLVALEGDVLVLHASGPKGRGYHQEVPTGEFTKIELYRGNKRTGAGVAKGAAKGAGLGAIGGAILGLAGSLFSEAFDFFDTHDSNVGESVVKGAAAGAATGAAVGAVDGVMNGEMQWEEITLDQVRTILCRQRGGTDCSAPPRAPDPAPASALAS